MIPNEAAEYEFRAPRCAQPRNDVLINRTVKAPLQAQLIFPWFAGARNCSGKISLKRQLFSFFAAAIACKQNNILLALRRPHPAAQRTTTARIAAHRWRGQREETK